VATINENLQTLQTTKASIKQAIESKGQDLTGVPFTQYASKIEDIQGGGGAVDSGGKYLVKVIDYDGTVLKQDHLNTGATFTLPDAPTNHSRLVFQEWSSPVNITNNSVTVEDNDIIIGAVYTTASGLNEFDITLTKATGLSISFKMVGTKDWGDGTSDTHETHTYTDYGNYTITCGGELDTTAISSTNGGIFGQNSGSQQNSYCTDIRLTLSYIHNYTFQYCIALNSVTLSNNVSTLSTYGFRDCHTLSAAVLPSSISGVGNYVFDGCYLASDIVLSNNLTTLGNSFHLDCYSLSNIIMHNNLKNIGQSAYRNCYKIKKVLIPSSVTNIGTNAFLDCYNITKYDFTKFTSIPTLGGTNSLGTINSMNKQSKIYVPDSLYDEWVAATNWSTYTDYIYKASEMPTEV
jgi:hypothetical protein